MEIVARKMFWIIFSSIQTPFSKKNRGLQTFLTHHFFEKIALLKDPSIQFW
jgi:hypothetical protein